MEVMGDIHEITSDTAFFLFRVYKELSKADKEIADYFKGFFEENIEKVFNPPLGKDEDESEQECEEERKSLGEIMKELDEKLEELDDIINSVKSKKKKNDKEDN